MSFKNCLACWREKAGNLRRINIILGGAAGFLLIIWGAAVLIFSDKDIGSEIAAGQIQSLSENIRRYYQNRPDFWGLSTQTVIDKQMAPRNMIVNGRLVNYFGKPVTAGNGEDGAMLMPGARHFDISYHGLNHQECAETASYKFNEKFWLGVTEVSINNGSQTEVFSWNHQQNILPVKKNLAEKICGSSNIVSWHFN